MLVSSRHIKFYSFFALSILFTFVHTQTGTYDIIIDEAFPTSAKYRINNYFQLDNTKPCIIINQADSTPLQCDTVGINCLCSGGYLIGLVPNTTYTVSIRNNDTIVSFTAFKTASNGVLTWNYSKNYIYYNITYGQNDIMPFSCISSLNSIESEKFGEPANDCVSKTFNSLLPNTSYALTVIARNSVMHEVRVTTGYYDASILSKGLIAFSYEVLTNIDLNYTLCEVIVTGTETKLTCFGRECQCLADSVTDLAEDTEYAFQIRANGTILADLQVKTAGSGVVSYLQTYNGLTFLVEYSDDQSIPSHCYPCTFDASVADMSVEECRDFVMMFVHDRVLCEIYYYENLIQDHLYGTILFDRYGSALTNKGYARVAKSEIIHRSYQLTSITYELVTELYYNPFQTCNVYDSYGSLRSCSVNGVITTDCPCKIGKLVNLGINTYVSVRIFQGNNLLAEDLLMYTADTGFPRINSLGVNHFEYFIFYSYNTHPPYQCSACLKEFDLGDISCSIDEITSGRGICRTFGWTNLKNATNYRLKIVDDDKVNHTHAYTFTSDYPVESSFLTSESTMTYRLIYNPNLPLPSACMIYFEEDPSLEVKCSESTKTCDCVGGVVILPNKNYRRLVIADSNSVVLAKNNVNSSNVSSLKAGVIVGVVMAVLAIIAVICALIVILVRWKRTVQLPNTEF